MKRSFNRAELTGEGAPASPHAACPHLKSSFGLARLSSREGGRHGTTVTSQEMSLHLAFFSKRRDKGARNRFDAKWGEPGSLGEEGV